MTHQEQHDENVNYAESDSIDMAGIPSNTVQSIYRTMVKIRRYEESIAQFLSEEIKCPVHLYTGQEAIAVGVCANLNEKDYTVSTHRSHGHYIAKGGELKPMTAELYGKRTGCSGGKGGSMHVTAPQVGFLGSSSIVAGSIPLAVGAALASKVRGDGRVSVAFFGDGATDEGVFHECLNFASLNKLPVLFICENNLFSTHLPILMRQPADNIHEKAQVHQMPGIRIDGNNVIEVFNVSRKAVEAARSGEGPTLLECRTFRWRSHVGPWRDLDVGFRTKEDVEYWMNRCPIEAYEKVLMEHGHLTHVDKERIVSEIDAEIEDALKYARDSDFPLDNELMDDLYKS